MLRWKLDHLVKEKDFDKKINYLEKLINKLKTYRSKLKPSLSEKTFKEIIELEEELTEKSNILGAFVGLKQSENTKEKHLKVWDAKLNKIGIKATDDLLFISRWFDGLEVPGLKKLDNKNAKRLFKSIPNLEFSLNKSRELAKHSLSEKEERLTIRKNSTGISIILELYGLITNDFTYKFRNKTVDSVELLKKYFYSSKAEDRELAYKALFEPYKNNIEKFHSIYTAVSTNWINMSELRKYKNPIQVRNISNGIPDKIVQTVIDTSVKNASIFHEYFKLKAKLIGMKKLRRYDIYAPVKKVTKKYSFQESKDLVLATYKEFHLPFYEKAKEIFDKGCIDSHPRKNKGTGAFAMLASPNLTPYIMLNHDDTYRDVETMAHELGHGIHDLYTQGNYPSVAHPGLTLAETASTLGENILFDRLLSRANKTERITMLSDKIGDAYASIIRQTFFIKFEQEVYSKIKDGLTYEQISDIYFKTLKEQFGTSLSIPEEFRYEWSYIPHMFRVPFYTYAYSFGDLLSMSLYAKYKTEGKSFIPKIEKILAAGGSQDPVKLLKSIGIDITKESFWQGGFDTIKERIVELKELTK